MINIENRRNLREYNINNKKYRLNIFETAKTPEENYLIGYLLGDGSFNAPTHKRKARLFVSSSDEYIVRAMRYHFQPDSSINRRIPINKTRGIVSKQKSSRMQFSSKWERTFKKYGILSKKEDRTYHNIKKDNMNYFILGLFDSDGCISWGRRKDRNRLWANFLITHPSLKMLTKLQRFFLEELNVATTISPKGKEKCFILRTSKLESVDRILKYMYQDTPNMYITRKLKHANDFMEEFKSWKY